MAQVTLLYLCILYALIFDEMFGKLPIQCTGCNGELVMVNFIALHETIASDV